MNIIKKELFKEDLKNLKKNYKFFFIFIFILYVHSITTNIVYYLHKQDKILNDILFDILPEYYNIGKISDIFSIVYFLFFFIFILHPYFIKRNYLTSDLLLIMIKTYSITMILRSLSFIFTILPSPSKQCNLNSTVYNPPKNIKEILTRMDLFTGCGDLIFSGHTTIIMIITLIIIFFLRGIFIKHIENIFIFFIILYTLFFLFIILIARNHYTVDIIISIYTTILTFYMVINNFKIKKYNILY